MKTVQCAADVLAEEENIEKPKEVGVRFHCI